MRIKKEGEKEKFIYLFIFGGREFLNLQACKNVKSVTINLVARINKNEGF